MVKVLHSYIYISFDIVLSISSFNTEHSMYVLREQFDFIDKAK